MNTMARLTAHIYRRLARAFPHEFRVIYGDEMEELGAEAAAELQRRFGVWGLFRLLADLGWRLLVEYALEFRQDVVYALRRLADAPAYAAVGAISLAMGIGFCTTFFSQMSTFRQPAPGIGDHHGLLAIQEQFSYAHFRQFEELDGVASATAFLGPTPFGVRFEREDEGTLRAFGHIVSPGYFETLRVKPALGRLLSPQTEKPGSPQVVVLSDNFWRGRLGGDPAVVGRTIHLNGKPVTIVGVGPPGFRGILPAAPADLFVTTTVGDALAPELSRGTLDDSSRKVFRFAFRAKPAADPEQIAAGLRVISTNLEEGHSDSDAATDAVKVSVMEGGRRFPVTPQQTRQMVLVNLLLLGITLSLACANLAGLQLARGLDRRKEVSIRVALGASRFRLIRQLLTESVVLALGGGIGGIAVATGLIRLSLAVQPEQMNPADLRYSIDVSVLLFAIGAAVAAGVTFGIVPALTASRRDVTSGLKLDRVGGRAYRRFGFRNLSVVYQVAASLALLMMTGYAVIGYWDTTSVDPGFSTDRLQIATLDPARDGLSEEQIIEFNRDFPNRLAAQAGIRSAAFAARPPMSEMVSLPNFTVSTSEPGSSESTQHRVRRERVGVGYFETLGISIVQGRAFEPADIGKFAENSHKSVILNQAAAQKMFGNESPLGRALHREEGDWIVAGVAEDTKTSHLNSRTVATVFVPITPNDFGRFAAGGLTLITRGLPGIDTAAVVREQLSRLSPTPTVLRIRTMREHIDQFDSVNTYAMIVNGSLGVFGLILASIGLAAVTTHAVARRRKEIGVRMALGARALQVHSLVLKEGVTLVAVGVALGFAGAFAISRAFASFVEQLDQVLGRSAGDPAIVVGIPVLLATIALITCYLPARHSTQISPVSALREE